MAWGLALTSLMAALVLGGDFGVASASGEPAVGNRILVTLEVEVLTSAEVVVAHLIEPGSEQETVSLSSTGDGIFRGAATVPKVDLVVVFEAVRGPNDSTLSSPAMVAESDPDRSGARCRTIGCTADATRRRSRCGSHLSHSHVRP